MPDKTFVRRPLPIACDRTYSSGAGAAGTLGSGRRRNCACYFLWIDAPNGLRGLEVAPFAIGPRGRSPAALAIGKALVDAIAIRPVGNDEQSDIFDGRRRDGHEREAKGILQASEPTGSDRSHPIQIARRGNFSLLSRASRPLEWRGIKQPRCNWATVRAFSSTKCLGSANGAPMNGLLAICGICREITSQRFAGEAVFSLNILK